MFENYLERVEKEVLETGLALMVVEEDLQSIEDLLVEYSNSKVDKFCSKLDKKYGWLEYIG